MYLETLLKRGIFFIAYMSILVKIVHKQIFRSYKYCSYCKLCCRLDILTYGEVFLDGVIVLGLMIFQRNDRSVQFVLMANTIFMIIWNVTMRLRLGKMK